MLTKVGVYAMIRVFTLIFAESAEVFYSAILPLAVLTMLTGVLGAMVQNHLRRILSFHIVSQIGYMLMGLGLAGLVKDRLPAVAALALAGTVFYIIHHILVKANLFLVSGVIRQARGTEKLDELGGFYAAAPGLAVLFAIPALSLAGMPPLSGFFAKLALVEAGLGAGQYTVVGIALAVSLLTMYSMSKVWLQVFWKPDPAAGKQPLGRRQPPRLALVPIGAMAALTIAIGLLAQPVMELSTAAAEQLLNRDRYIHAVMGGPR
jgi:multicomponent Na+:H+ antiporter subunit D